MLRDIELLAGIPAPGGEEGERAAWVQGRLGDSLGHTQQDEVGNVLWTFGDEDPDVLLLAHLDSVFPQSVDVSTRRSNGWIEGAGVGDNACGVAVSMSVVQDLVANHGPLPLAVGFTVGEEGLGNLRGALAALEELAPRRVVAVEGHGLGSTVVDGVGSVRAHLRIEGPGGHSWWDRNHPSALHEMIEILKEMLSGDRGVHVNIGTIEGGSSVNAIAGECVALVEARSVDGDSLERFDTTLGEISVRHPLLAACEVIGRRPAGRLDPEGKLVAAVRRVRQLLDLPDELGDGSTDANAALVHHIPAIGLGCAFGSGMHSVGERIEASSVEIGHAQLRLGLEYALGLVQSDLVP